MDSISKPADRRLDGSDAAFAEVAALIREWEDTRTGGLEELAVLVVRDGMTLEEALSCLKKKTENACSDRPLKPS